MKYKKIIRIFIGVIIFIYVLFSSNVLDKVKDLSGSVSKYTTKETTSINGDLFVYFIDVGQADSILISNDGHYMLIDAGNNEDGALLVSYLESMKIQKIDYVVATHPHEDHIGGMDDIINNFEIGKYFMSDVVTTTKTFEDVLDALEINDLTYSVPKENETYNLGDAKINVVHAKERKNDLNDLNDSSIVLRLTYGNNSFLFTGDATKRIEDKILDSNINIKSDVLKVAHHGSDYSSSDAFLKAVNPAYAVISVGKGNTYNHPSIFTLDKLNALNVKVYRTDLSGTIIFKSDGNSISVETVKTNTNG